MAEGRSDPRVQTLIELANENRVGWRLGNAERRELDAWVEGVHQGVVADVSPSQVWGGAMLDERWIAPRAHRCCWCSTV